MILILWYLILKIGGLTQKYYLSEVVLRDAGVKPRKTLQHETCLFEYVANNN